MLKLLRPRGNSSGLRAEMERALSDLAAAQNALDNADAAYIDEVVHRLNAALARVQVLSAEARRT